MSLRDRLPAGAAVHRAARLRRLALVGVVAGALVLVLLGVRSVADTDDGFRLRASFDDASPLLEGNDVRLGGVKVGSVESLGIDGRTADVELLLDDTALPLYENARLTIRPVSLLGERYVELDRGTPDAPELAEGGRIGVDATGSATDLDEVLDAVDDPTGQALAMLVGTLGDGLEGNGEAVDAAVRALAPALTQTGEVTGVLAEQNATLSELVTSMEQVADGLVAGEGEQLDALVGSAEQLLGVTAANEAAFRAMLEQLPGTLTSARETLAALTATADATTPTLAALRPTTDDLGAISEELLAFADTTDRALAAANPVLDRADELLDAAAPVAAVLRQSAPALTADVAALDPLTADLAGDFRTVMEFIRGWALATNGRDGLSHYFRGGAVLTEYAASGLLPVGDTGHEEPRAGALQAPSGATPEAPEAPAPATPVVPDLLGGLGLGDLSDGLGLSAGNGLLSGLLAPRRTSDGGVTGLDAEQERGALGFLLGGI